MDEKKWMDAIKKSAEKIRTPESLEPEQMREKLDAQKKEKSAGAFSGKYGMLRRYSVRVAEIAAAVVLVFAVGHQAGVLQERRTVRQQNPALMADGAQKDTESAAPENAQKDTENAAPENAQDDADGTAISVQKGQMIASADVQDQAGSVQEDTQSGDAENGISDMMLENAPKVADVPKDAGAEKSADTLEDAGAPEAEAAQETEMALVHEEGIAPIGSEDELYEALKERYNQVSLYRSMDLGAGNMEVEAEMADGAPQAVAEEMKITAETGADTDYSQTNLRELGVDEGDIVKTDGEYLYIMKNDSSVKIVRADGTEMALIAELKPGDLSESVRDLYVSGNTLVAVMGGSGTNMVESEKDVYVTQTYSYVEAWTYDISNRSHPKLLGAMDQEGSYQSSRKIGDCVYLFTRFQPEIGDTRIDSRIMPLVNGAYLEADDIYVPESLENTDYLVIGSMNLKDPSTAVSHKAVVSGADNFYVSPDSIYIYNENYTTGEQRTDILKFGCEDGQVWGVGACSVQGYLNDSFSIDEYEGNLRVLTTRWDSRNINTLHVFDEKLAEIGKIDNIAEGETIRSARFMGDTGYFVTFRNTDPLFSVDLSDPANPKILGELKVTGFSSYLHYYGNDRLLGIGYEADEETGRTTGVKLSMFDVSDPANVTECKRYIIKDAQSVPALSNYKAVMISPEKNLFGFVCDNNYLVFTCDEQEGFQNLLSYNLSEGESLPGYYYWYEHDDVRGVYIEDTFYLVQSDKIRAFDMENAFTQTAKLEI